MQNNTISFKIAKKDIEKISKDYKNYIQQNHNKNIYIFIKTQKLTLSIFTTQKLLIQGQEDAIYSFLLKFFPDQKSLAYKKDLPSENVIFDDFDNIGCDEVGTGDYFGPIITCACLVKKINVEKIKKLGIDDSKKFDDKKIKQIFKKLKPLVEYEICTCSPTEYNQMTNNKINAAAIKSICHNTSLNNLLNLHKIKKESVKIVLDQYVSKQKYYEYLQNLDCEKILIDIFETKAESKYLAVACASIIARNFFLIEMEKLSKKAKISLPFGSSNLNKIIKTGKIIDQNGDLENFAKLHFESITKKIKNI